MISSVHLTHGQRTASPVRFGEQQAQAVRQFHRSFPEYAPTPLIRLDALAKSLGVARISVKDESYRFGLNAFKVLGGSYAIGNVIAEKLGIHPAALSYSLLTSPATAEKLGKLTFVTATDGNHGRGVAWTANRLGMNCVVYLPRGSAQERLMNIRALGAQATITDLNYDDAVRLANRMAEENGWIMVQDTAWEGYESIPTWIMQGYTTMALEAWEQLAGEKPTHIFLQAGVGAMAGAVTGFFADLFGEERPIITIVEPEQADCLFRSAKAGALRCVSGDLKTIMAGLACGEPCTVGWQMLQNYADFFISMSDEYAAQGMRVLGNPLPGDPRVISGESGAATVGLVSALLRDPAQADLRQQLGLDAHSRILCFSTEGDTDRENYRRVVWEGLYPSCSGADAGR